MGNLQALHCLLWLLVGYAGFCSAGLSGTEFITVFLQNHNAQTGNPSLTLSITAHHPATSVNVAINKHSFRKRVNLDALEQATVELPVIVHMTPSKPFDYTVIILSNNPISVVSNNYKPESADSTYLYPVEELGMKYYVFTPADGPEGSFKEFAVATKDPTTVTIYPTGSVTFRDKQYGKGSKLVFNLEAYQAIEFQSNDDLSGTIVESRKQVCVLSGHTCCQKLTKCNHVYEQLRSVDYWGTIFLIPPSPFQTKYDLVYIMAYQSTQVTYQAGTLKNTQELQVGNNLEIQLNPDTPLSITSTEGIQVFLLSAGGRYGTMTFDTFLMDVPDVNSYCTTYLAGGLTDFNSKAIMVVKTSSLPKLTIDQVSVKDVSWQEIPETSYSWGVFPLQSDSKLNTVEDLDSPFGLLVLGIAPQNAYGEQGICIKGLARASCSQVKCRKQEFCKIVQGKAMCLAKHEASCWAWGDPHYHTFDSRNYDFQGTCAYTMVKTCGPDLTLPAFNVEVKNENRGSALVSYISYVNIQLYGFNVSAVRSELGTVRVNNQKTALPVTLHDGDLKLIQSGTNLIIATDFSLKVFYDWNNLIKVNLPSSFADNVCGMCGNFNGNLNDDLHSSEGLSLSPIDFGRRWKVTDVNGAGTCWDDCNGPCKKCPFSQMVQFGNNTQCGIIALRKDGPFRNCHSLVDPQLYKDSCVYDLCMNDGYQQILCQALKTYSDACQRAGATVHDWRSFAGCGGMECPSNSTYRACGSACLATCEDPNTLSKCSEPCIETCECDPGFVMIKGKCMPKEYCGCEYQGRFYAPNDTFWKDDQCKEKCVCDESSHKVQCSKRGCKSGEECKVQNGLLGCYATTYGTCSSSGDPHYITYDGLHYDFQGTCEYLLSGLCNNNSGKTDFQVKMRNENRGSRVVSYAASVTFTIYSTEIQIRREFPNQVMVNGILSNIPLTLISGRVSVFQSGRHCVIQTQSGIRVTFDWDARVQVMIPSSYANLVCGLCGNFNKNTDDDLLTSYENGSIINDSFVFAKSWKVGDVPGCHEDPNKNCAELKQLEAQQRKSLEGCGILLDHKGPFRDCHAVIPPEGYFKDCVFDFCAFGQLPDITCRLMAGYAAACQEAKATVHQWRSQTFCPLLCPVNSHYDVCSSGCPSTCLSLTSYSICNSPCREGCSCDDGFILSGGQCVPLSECGCSYKGLYYKTNDIFFPEDTCEKRCTCKLGGSIECSPFSCGPYEECRVEKGVQSCQPNGSSICSAVGQSYYRTFDGFGYDIYGNCSYTIAKTCLLDGSSLTPFHLQRQNIITSDPSNSRNITVDIYNYTINIIQGSESKVLVNGEVKTLPFDLDSGRVRVIPRGVAVVLSTTFGLIVDSDLSLYVTIPATYHNQMCGLCGNYNDNPEDELNQNNGDVVAFATSWVESQSDSSCVTNNSCVGMDLNCPVCPKSKADILAGAKYCGILTALNKPFSVCNAIVDPSSYVASCVNDLCTRTGELCSVIQSYVKACRDAGVVIEPWRSPTFCPFTCPEHSHYEPCTNLCTTSCSSMYDISSCPDSCSEGCQCDSGYFFQNGACILPQDCGCYYNSSYYRANQTIVSPDCSQRCTCTSGLSMTCEAYGCASDEKCIIVDGSLGCVNVDPCRSITCRSKERCVAQGDVATCVPEYNGTCWHWGGVHYQSFDGYSYDFQGTCSYVLSRYVGNDSSLEYFSIEETKDNGGTASLSFLKSVNIFVYNYNVTLTKGSYGSALVNDIAVNLPVTLMNGKLTIMSSGFSVILKTTFGLALSFGPDNQVSLTIPSSYYRGTAGLCGNFNEDSKDEKLTLDNKTVDSVTEWAKSWKTQTEDPFCWDTCHENCLTCDENQKSVYEGVKYCGLIKAEDGPFKECHAKINPEVIFNNCVNDVCSKDGAQRFACHALEMYAEMCRKEGVTITDWRKTSGCDFQCPKNSHYEACGTACPASCVDRTAPGRCSEPCVETCQCDDGHILSAGTCVNASSCGCIYNSNYYQPNQVFWANDKCSVQCKCVSSLGIVECKQTSCRAGEKCTTLNGVQGCHPVNYSTCVASGDPHFVTFDGRRYDFMGTCVYTLATVCLSDSSLPYFNVKIQNENRGKQAVSSAKSVTLEVYNQSITLTRDHPQFVLVNGVVTSIPFTFKGSKIKVFMKGEHAFVRTDFDMTINFNWDNYARVMVPSTYTNALCGLCGNFNQDPKDDLTPDDDEQVTDHIAFGDRYRVAEIPGCTGGCKENCPRCDEEQMKKYQGEAYCGILIDRDGPLSQCFGVVDPMPFFSDCIYDSCQYQGFHSVSCSAIAGYVSECQNLGVTIRTWRTSTFCDMSCPTDSHYYLCGTGRHPTCADLSSPADFVKSCMEGCYCDNGFVLSGDKCVHLSQCGCVLQGQYYKRGEEFYSEGQCKTQCQCLENGNVLCRDVTCGPGEECAVVNGVRGCFSKKKGSCTVSANRHVLSFDGLGYDFQGTCSYTLAKLHGEHPELGNFSVVLENEGLGKDKIAAMKLLKVEVYGYEIIMKKGDLWKVQIDGEDYSLPLNLESSKMMITQEGSTLKLQTDFELVVLYDSTSLVKVSIPGAYQGETRGLCGDFNGQDNDDLRLPSGELSTDVEKFGAAWSTTSTDCVHGCQEHCDGCDPMRAAIFGRDEACGLLLLDDGPFAGCKELVNATDYFNHCLTDMCASDGTKGTLCQILQAYTTACQDAGAKIKPWRTPTFCPITCPKNSHYDVCARTCDVTCYSIVSPPSCSDTCFEGCQCDDGYQFDGSRCVEMDTCGCVHNGRYLQLGASLVSPDCLQSCTCSAGGVVSCTDLTCSDEAFCGLESGERGCVKRQGTCSVSAKGSLVTFDKLSAPVLPGVTFEISSICKPSLDSWFRFVAITENCGAEGALQVSAVHAYIEGLSIAVNLLGETWVSGRAVNLPFHANGALSVISDGEATVLRKGDLVKLILSKTGEITVRVSEELVGALCGACGNFNRQKSDDLQVPGGKSMTDVTRFVASWTAQDFSTCNP